MKKLTAVFLLAAVPLIAQSGQCVAGMINGDAETGDLTGWSGSSSVAAVMSQAQLTGTVNPFQGDWFFTFASQQASSASMEQDGTMAIGNGPILRLTGAYQTELGDLAEAVITLLDAGSSPVAQQTTGPVFTPDLEWQTFSIDVAVPPTAVSWKVELLGTLVTGSFVNVFFDDIQLVAIPEPSSLLLASLAGVSRLP